MTHVAAFVVFVSTLLHVEAGLPGVPLRELAEQRGILFGTDIMDSWPNPFESDQSYMSIASQQFGYGTWDFCASWSVAQPDGPDQPYDFSRFDAVVPFMRNANMTVRTNGILPDSHNLYAPISTDLPKWLTSGYLAGNFTETQLQDLLRRHIQTAIPHWLGTGLRMAGVIVVNEAFWNQQMTGTWPSNWIFGPKENMFSWAFQNSTRWFSQAFHWTKEAVNAASAHNHIAPPRLFYSDYSIETPTAKADAVYNFLKEELQAGTPIDGIGFQAHMSCDCGGYPAQPGCNNASLIAANMQRFVDLGLSVWVTELDVAMVEGCTPQMQADVYQAVVSACLRIAPHCDAVMLWGFTDRFTWLQPNATKAPTILDANYRPKPAYFALQRELESPP